MGCKNWIRLDREWIWFGFRWRLRLNRSSWGGSDPPQPAIACSIWRLRNSHHSHNTVRQSNMAMENWFVLDSLLVLFKPPFIVYDFPASHVYQGKQFLCGQRSSRSQAAPLHQFQHFAIAGIIRNQWLHSFRLMLSGPRPMKTHTFLETAVTTMTRINKTTSVDGRLVWYMIYILQCG